MPSVTPVEPVKPTPPIEQGERAPSRGLAIEVLGELLRLPSDIPVPENPPIGYDRMAEIAQANSASGLTRAFSGGLPEGFKPVSTEPVVETPNVTE